MYICIYICIPSTANRHTELLGLSVGSHVKGLGKGAVGISVSNVGGVPVQLLSGRGRSKAGQGSDAGDGGGDDGGGTHFDGM